MVRSRKTLFPALLLSLCAACGGGDDQPPTPTGSASHCPAPPDGGKWTFPDPVDPNNEMQPDPGFEGAIGNTPQGWGHVEWDGASYSAGAEKMLVHGGSQAYWYKRIGTGSSRIYCTPGFELDHTYAIKLFARADAATKIQVSVMSTKEGTPEEARTVAIGPDGWTEINLEVVYPKRTEGTLWVVPVDSDVRIVLDDVSIRDISPEPDYTPVLTSEIRPEQIGIHVNKWGLHNAIPDAGQGLVRLHDTGTSWNVLEPTKGDWENAHTDRLDYLLDNIEKIPGGPEVIFELGLTPAWAAQDKALGIQSPPANAADFANYVKYVAKLHQGRMRYWELWNEYNQPEFWKGTQAQMVELAKVARAALIAADPENRLLSPSVTVSRITDIGGFLDAGGGEHVDIMTFHAYFTAKPEALRSVIRNVRRMLAERGVDKPLWNTEGGLGCDAISMDCAEPEAALTDAQVRGAIARSLIVQRAEGVESFSYYLWDRWKKKDDGSSGEPKDWTVNMSLVHEDFETPTVSGIAFRTVAGWLVGARFVSGKRLADGTFLYEIARAGGYRGFIAWNPDKQVPLPFGADWGITTARHTDGSSEDVDGCTVDVTEDPVLLENRAP
ncbi:hypothetical protein [Polyangium aurulentum]|uniref:hypothetical protein n=1 Tax=Polyangium aurulentum TaxID=2567896 RepID=UPI00146BA2BF|nr:hypothetical protein [Polyangium aurulentum]UQA59076.1 hypothetical protein E8A73_000740 [Polyangium aurulentum]